MLALGGAFLVIWIVGNAGMLFAPLVALLWLVIIYTKGYLVFALPLFLPTLALFLFSPTGETAFFLVMPMLLLACLPARRRALDGSWQISSRDGSLKSWFFPADAREDTGAAPGDGSIHLMLVFSLILCAGIFITALSPSILGGPSTQTTDTVAQFSLSELSLSGEKEVGFECQLDNGPWRSCSSEPVYRGLEPGAHTFRARHSDPRYGSLASDSTWSWTVLEKDQRESAGR